MSTHRCVVDLGENFDGILADCPEAISAYRSNAISRRSSGPFSTLMPNFSRKLLGTFAKARDEHQVDTRRHLQVLSDPGGGQEGCDG